MILLRPGWESDYHGRPPVFGSGCAGCIESCQSLDDGRYDIVLRGLSRFRVIEEHAGQPYRLATVEPCPEREEDEPAHLDTARRRVLTAIGKAADGPAVMVLNSDLPHAVFVDALSQSLPLAPLERQSLLEEAQQVRMRLETERVRNTLLSAVSHDLRTPMAAIKGSATSLIAGHRTLDDATRLEFPACTLSRVL